MRNTRIMGGVFDMYTFLVIGSAQLGSISAKIAYYAHNHNMRTAYRRKLVDP